MRATAPNFTLLVAKRILRGILYAQTVLPQTNAARDARIRERYAAGETISELAREHGVSPQRVSQIVNQK